MGETIQYNNIKVVNLFYYDFEKSHIPLRIIGLIKYSFYSKIILKYSFDIVYIHSPEFMIPFVFYRNQKSKFILHLHGAGIPTEVARFRFARNSVFSLIWKKIEKVSFSKANRIITIDNDCEQLLKRYNLYYKAFPLRNAVNKKIFFYDNNKRVELRNKLNIDSKSKILLFVGRLHKF